MRLLLCSPYASLTECTPLAPARLPRSPPSCLFAFFDVKDDSPELLASDVHRAGAGICNDPAVMKLAREGPRRVEEMLLSGSAEVRIRRGASCVG